MQKKKFISIYLVFVILCILITVYQCGQVTEKFGEELYGIATDDTIELDEDTEVAAEFVLKEEELRGVSVKFQTEEKFDAEKMKAQLYDGETDELLAEDTVVLKYERIQNKDGGSFIYFSLPQKQAKDKNVRLVFSMDGKVKVKPSLVVSKNAVNSSKLKNGNKDSDKNLVFKTRYFLGESRNYGAVAANGIYLCALGTLLFFFAYKRKNQRHSENEKACGKKRFMEQKFIWKRSLQPVMGRRDYIILFFMLAFVGFYLIYVYRFGVSSAIKENSYFFLKKMYALFGILVLVASAVICACCMRKQLPVEKAFVPVGLCLGILFSLVICLDTVPDEPSHVDTAYALSNEILRIPESGKPGYIFKRVEDIDSDAEERQSLDVENYKWMYQKRFWTAEDETLAECSVRSNLGNGGKIYYLPQALGISIGRILGLGMLPVMMLGRFFSLICYIILVYSAIRKVPVGKLTLFLIGILPISLQQAASMSYDGMINGIAMLYLAYNVYAFYGGRRLEVSDIAVIALTGSLMATVKGGTYIPLCLLPLMLLWTRKDLLKEEKISIVSIVGLFIFTFAKDRLIGTLSTLSVSQGAAIGGAKSKEVYTFGYLLRRPVRLIGLYVNTIHEQGSEQLRNLFGGNLAWRDINIDWYLVIFLIILILLSCIRQGKEKYIPRLDKAYMGVLALGSFGLIELSMLLVWTPVTYNYITGAQGRYFIPFLFLILLCLRNSFFTVKKNIERQIMLLFCVTDLLIVLQVVLIALE